MQRFINFSSVAIQLQIVVSLVIFVFAKPLEIDRKALFIDSKYEIVSDAPDRVLTSLNSKLKILIKPKYTPQEINREYSEFSFKNIFFLSENNQKIFKPPKSLYCNNPPCKDI